MEEGGQETEKVSEQRRCHGKKSVTDEVDRVATLMFQLGELPHSVFEHWTVTFNWTVTFGENVVASLLYDGRGFC